MGKGLVLNMGFMGMIPVFQLGMEVHIGMFLGKVEDRLDKRKRELRAEHYRFTTW